MTNLWKSLKQLIIEKTITKYLDLKKNYKNNSDILWYILLPFSFHCFHLLIFLQSIPKKDVS